MFVGWGAEFAPYVASIFRSSPTFQTDLRVENLWGVGNVPALTMRQRVAAEQAKSAWTTGCLTCAESGRKSKFLSVSKIAIVLECCAILCNLLMLVETEWIVMQGVLARCQLAKSNCHGRQMVVPSAGGSL